jgi:hypothetical protein
MKVTTDVCRAASGHVKQLAGCLAGQVVLYALLCAAGWTTGTTLLEISTFGFPSTVLLAWFVAITYGLMFALPTLFLLVILRLVAYVMSAKALRRTALVVLPLVAVALPIETPPSTQYGAQLVIQFPIQVAMALLLRPPAVMSNDEDDELLAAWGLTPNPDAVGRMHWWYGLPLVTLVWLVLLLASGYPLLFN